jgi:hypothetical protein
MAKQSKIFIKGSIGNVVFYELGGQHIARSKPARVKRTVNMKQRNINFGIASRLGKTLRAALTPLLFYPKADKSPGRFSGAISKWLGTQPINELASNPSIAALQNFSFNPATGFTDRFKARLDIQFQPPGEVLINIPAFIPTNVLAAPVNTIFADLRLILTTGNVSDVSAGFSETFELRIDYNSIQQPAQQLQYSITAPPGTLVIVAASLAFSLKNGKKEMREKFMPASVLLAGYWA